MDGNSNLHRSVRPCAVAPRIEDRSAAPSIGRLPLSPRPNKIVLERCNRSSFGLVQSLNWTPLGEFFVLAAYYRPFTAKAFNRVRIRSPSEPPSSNQSATRFKISFARPTSLLIQSNQAKASGFESCGRKDGQQSTGSASSGVC